MSHRIDSTISHARGKASGLRARLAGLVGVFRTSSEQHGELSALIARAKSDPRRRAELWPELRVELLAHEHAELRVVYAELRGHAETRALAERHGREARQIERLSAQLDELALDSPDWLGAFDELALLFVQHANEEEKRIFPAAQRALGAPLARQLDAAFRTARRQSAEHVG
ncbi:MAG TPA: hemerythrin domain-containing protein [Kofleriaceae bacterium]|nr:hemerythrin domain-containing protein [Kofleriaceae bacterium]